jgi:hypothetical protein
MGFGNNHNEYMYFKGIVTKHDQEIRATSKYQ